MPRSRKPINTLLQRIIAQPNRPGQSALVIFQAAFHAHQTGKLDEAETGYRQLLAIDTRHADGFYLLGVLQQRKGELHEAEILFRQALGIREDGRFLFSLGSLLHDAGRLQDAEVAYRRALELTPNYAEACNNLGNLLRQTNRLPEAEATYRRALAAKPDFFQAHNNLGNLLKATNRLPEAEMAYCRALELNPHYADAYGNLGTVLKAANRLPEAEAAYRRALELDPDYINGHINLGTLLMEAGRVADAETAYGRAIALNPHAADAYNNLGILLQKVNRPTEAETAYRRALAVKPDFPQAYNNLGNLLKEAARLHEAEAAYRLAVELNPHYADAHNNLGTALKESGRLDQAMACYRLALEIAPDNADAHLNHAFALLQRGDFARGWQEYEYRWKIGGNDRRRQFDRPLWLGEVDLAGKSIFLHAEQGFGDTLQFVRYATLLAARGAMVYLGAPSELKSLAASCVGITAVFGSGDALPSFDYHCPLMSLPLACQTELQTIPAEVPYLASSAAGNARWREKLGSKIALRVGLAWAGNPRKHMPSVHAVDRQRSIDFDHLRPLLELADIEFFSLQLGDAAVSQLQGHPQVIDFTADIRDFQDTAALMDNLDLIISVDTAVAHLAGALGKPVWMLNRYNTCWRWLMDREDSPWYPSMRIFRQSSLGDWDSVIGNVKEALEARVRVSSITC